MVHAAHQYARRLAAAMSCPDWLSAGSCIDLAGQERGRFEMMFLPDVLETPWRTTPGAHAVDLLLFARQSADPNVLVDRTPAVTGRVRLRRARPGVRRRAGWTQAWSGRPPPAGPYSSGQS